MQKVLLTVLLAVIVIGVFTSASVNAQMRNVTFLVNSSTVPDTVSSLYPMQIRGGSAPLTWGNDTQGNLNNIGGDYWSVTLQFNVGENIHFKIFAGTGGWEQNIQDVNGNNDGNRSYIVADVDTTLPVEFFNNGVANAPQYFRPWAAASDTMMNVYFRVNMDGVMQAGSFGFNNNTDTVGVRGGGPAGGDLNWSPTFYLTRESPASNGGFGYPANRFWSGRLLIPKNGVTEGQEIQYKYLIGYDWGRDELQGGAPNRKFTVPVGKNDTTLHLVFFNNQVPVARVNGDTAIVTFRANMAKAIQTGGFSIGDTVVVRSGYFGTAVESGREQRLLRQGLTTVYAVTDTIITAYNQTLDYQYYLRKLGQDVRENYYNFYYPGEVQAEAERRQLTMPASSPVTIEDTASSITEARRQPYFSNSRTLVRNVDVRWEVDIRPAYYQVLKGDTLTDIQGSFHVTDKDSVLPWGVWMNGPAVGGWSNPGSTDWDFGLMNNLDKKLYDDGTHGDVAAGDSIFTRTLTFSADSLGIGTKGQIGQVFKYGVKGGDNEGGKGGYGNNHAENIDDATSNFVLRTQFGSINPKFYDAWDYNCECPITAVDEPGELPKAFSLSQNYPNPFNPSTKIQYAISSPSFVTLKVYNVLGQVVASLVNEKQSIGNYSVSLDASRLSSGVYFYNLTAGSFVSTKKMLLLK